MRRSTSTYCPNKGRAPPHAFCSQCYANRKGREANKGHLYLFCSSVFHNLLGSITMKRPSTSQAPTKGQWSCPDEKFLKTYPTLAAGLCDCWWDDGKKRIPWTMTIRFEDGSVHLCLNDKESGQGAYTTGSSLPDVFQLVEEALLEDLLSWRKWKR